MLLCVTTKQQNPPHFLLNLFFFDFFEWVMGMTFHPFEKKKIKNSSFFAPIQFVQPIQVVLVQFKIKQVDVGLNSLRVATFRDHYNVPLD